MDRVQSSSSAPPPTRASAPRSERARTVFTALFLVFLVFPLAQAWTLGGWRAWGGTVAFGLFAFWYVVGLLAGENPSPRWVRGLRVGPWLLGIVLCCVLATAVIGPLGLFVLFYLAPGLGGAVPNRAGAIGIVATGVAFAGVATALGVEPSWALGSAMAAMLIGLSVWFSTRAEVTQRALLAEREQKAALAVDLERLRLARDLHDILGHSLTVVTVKAQLAGRLVDTDPARARTEIADVERLARDALADVRSTVRSYREASLPAELAGARRALEAAGIEAEIPGSAEQVRSELRDLFAWVVREGVTNVVRHSGATSVVIRLGADSVEIEDDGHGPGPVAVEGNGLTGLRERARQVGAVLTSGPAPHGSGTLLRAAAATAQETMSS